MSQYTEQIERQVDESIVKSVKDIEDLKVKVLQSIAECDSVGAIAHGVHGVVREAMSRLMHVGAHPDCGARHEHLIKSVLIMEHLMLPVIHCMLERPGRENFTRFKEALLARVLGVFTDHIVNIRTPMFRQQIINHALEGVTANDAFIEMMQSQEGDSGVKKPTYH